MRTCVAPLDPPPRGGHPDGGTARCVIAIHVSHRGVSGAGGAGRLRLRCSRRTIGRRWRGLKWRPGALILREFILGEGRILCQRPSRWGVTARKCAAGRAHPIPRAR